MYANLSSSFFCLTCSRWSSSLSLTSFCWMHLMYSQAFRRMMTFGALWFSSSSGIFSRSMSKLFLRSFLLFLSRTLCEALLASSSESLLFCDDCDDIRTNRFGCLFFLAGDEMGDECLDTGALCEAFLWLTSRCSKRSTVTTSISSSEGEREIGREIKLVDFKVL